MGIRWISEACDLPPDPVSGAAICRLTTAPCINSNIYCEQPHSSPDGNRVTLWRFWRPADFRRSSLLVADLERLKLVEIEPEGSLTGKLCTAAYRGYTYYLRHSGELMRVCLETLEKEVVLSKPELPAGLTLGSVSPDLGHAVGWTILPGPTVGIFEVGLADGSWRMIFEHPEIVNPHLQYNPVHGKQILIQHNRGSQMGPDGTVISYVSEQGTTLLVLDRQNGEVTQCPVGPPHTAGTTGHEAFMADTGKAAVTTSWRIEPDYSAWRHHEAHPQGNLCIVQPGADKPEVFSAPEHCFNHLCISRCGRYFLSDSYLHPLTGPVPLVVGNLKTGKYRTLVSDCGASCGGAQYTHPHAYFTADTRHVIYVADPRGIPHVFKARLPVDFLQSLD